MNRKSKIEIRRDAILDLLRSEGRVYVSKLSKQFSTTEVTIRNDLSAMEEAGKHDTARAAGNPFTGEAFDLIDEILKQKS